MTPDQLRQAFAHTAEAAFYFPYPLLNQRLDLLQHLTQFSDRILVIRGEAGSGKTTLLQHLIDRLDSEARLCRLHADERLTNEALITALGKALGLHTSAGIDMIKQRLSDMQHSTSVCHLLIDDAHQLPATTLTTLMSLFYSKGGNALHIALFAEPGIVALLTGTGIASHLGERLQTMGMPALEEEDCAAYLQHRLQAAGHQGPSPFTPAQVRDIHGRSGGLPGRVNAEAARLLSTPPARQDGKADARQADKPAPAMAPVQQPAAVAEPATRPSARPVADKPKTPFKPGQKRALTWTLAGVFAALIATLLIMQEEINQAFTGPAAVAPSTAITPPAPTPGTEVLTTPRINEAAMPAMTDHGQEARYDALHTPTTQAAATTPAISATTEAEFTPAPAVPVPAAAPQTKQASPAPAAVEEDTADADATSAAEAESSKPQPETVPANGLRNADWLLAQPAQDYTLQLIGSTQEGVIRDFAHRHAIEAQAAYFRGLRKGQPWYSLVYGIYPSKEAALTARSELPPLLQKQSPWVRSLASIHADIRKAGTP